MTNDQVDKAIAFLLDSQASLTADLQALTVQVGTLAAKVDAVTELANGSREIANRTAESVLKLVEAQQRTDEQLNRLASLFLAHVSDSHGGGPIA